MTTPAQIAAELEALAAECRDSTRNCKATRDMALSSLRMKLLIHVDTIIAALKAMEEQTDDE